MNSLRAFYQSSVSNFLKSDNDKILGEINKNNYSFETKIQQKNTWIKEIEILKRELKNLIDEDSRILFEYVIPRMGKRIDNVILYKNIIFLLEFKCGNNCYYSSDYDQIYDYALDLKNFHKESGDKLIVPILIATEAPSFNNSILIDNKVMVPLKCNEFGIGNLITNIVSSFKEESFSYDGWISSEYFPTPTIIEAAQALYTNHSVMDIARNDAGAKNLTLTTNALNEIISFSKQNHRKSICFVTGVPGAGKTLVGLNLGIQKSDLIKEDHAVFLSGNFPLVEVLQEALVRDKLKKMKDPNEKVNKSEVKRKTNAFIQIIHKYRDSYINNNNIPPEHVVIYDEAQRSWNSEKIADFMKNKKGIADFNYSEPEFLISTLDRHKDWAVVICLIGGGQEINDGEAGLPEWFKALRERFNYWDVYVSNNLKDEYLIDNTWKDLIRDLNLKYVPDLHLSVSLRSFRSPHVSGFIKALLDNDLIKSKKLYSSIKENYPIKLTRNLDTAKKWVKDKSKGSEKYGLLATSGGLRLKAEGIFVKNKVNVANWFLNDKEDVRSCYALEDVITEFDVQGLELDYSIVAWDADLRMINGKWEYKKFRGSKWNNINKPDDRLYLKNSYRVLLTRSRQGMIIFIPKGSDSDATRAKVFYDGTYEYLKNIGIEEL
ncbi:DUF2075 domain-containing protein [Peptoniphilus grossensis]|uniref:DUF2075 domain-containing protein n=1 Tax=Peptoniphilus grossensis TaxID=1465756 RepID=UPI0002F541CF|nr:DUF2075 domain-containing protein [Peptoniphilus grossensis]